MKKISVFTIFALLMIPFWLVLADDVDVASNRPELIPAGKPGVKDVHSFHVFDCENCHKKAKDSMWASDLLIPAMKTCASCHSEAKDVTPATKESEKCSKCHINNKNKKGFYPRPDIRFNHKKHYKAGCISCHNSGDTAAAMSPDNMPSMRQCYECHVKKKKLKNCNVCHLSYRNQKMITNIKEMRLTPPTWLAGPTHNARWVFSHAQKAGRDSQLCASCHLEQFCRDCHAGKRRPKKAHPGDWINTHGISTRIDNPRCKGCHKKQSFCIKCHRRAGVALDSPKELKSNGNASFHGQKTPSEICRRAKSNITACVSCHSESSCIKCHAAINPHPPGFASKCKKLAMKNSSSCARCHAFDPVKRCK